MSALSTYTSAFSASYVVIILLQSVATLQSPIALNPVAVSIDATCLAMRFYSGGVFDDVDCGTDLDHAVLATGYGIEGGQKYYNFKK